MIAQQRGKIINIASIAGLRGTPSELPAIGYSSSKGGVIAFTRDLAWKWGMHGIRVNAIAPGWFPSDMSQKDHRTASGQTPGLDPAGPLGQLPKTSKERLFFSLPTHPISSPDTFS